MLVDFVFLSSQLEKRVYPKTTFITEQEGINTHETFKQT